MDSCKLSSFLKESLAIGALALATFAAACGRHQEDIPDHSIYHCAPVTTERGCGPMESSNPLPVGQRYPIDCDVTSTMQSGMSGGALHCYCAARTADAGESFGWTCPD